MLTGASEQGGQAGSIDASGKLAHGPPAASLTLVQVPAHGPACQQTVYPCRNGTGHAHDGGSGIIAPGGTTMTGPQGNEVHVTGS